ncbi:hypothetical protein MSPP1_003688 [Malassezia sp. CBS 17886]|nr:hypothetical protein MSPP1_003688 [Malassezia sp. CBS 17886]
MDDRAGRAGAYRAAAATSSSPNSATRAMSSSPPSSPTYGRSTSTASRLSADPFSGSAKLPEGPAPRTTRLARAATTPSTPAAFDDMRPARFESLTLVPPKQRAARDAPNQVLSQFFASSSEDSLLSSDDAPGSSGEARMGGSPSRTRVFTRTASANTDPLSAAGGPRGGTAPPARATRRLRPTGTSPKKLTRQARAGKHVAPLPSWEQSEDSMDEAPQSSPRAALTAAERRADALCWQEQVNAIFDEGRERPALLLGGCGIAHIPPCVGDLDDYVAIAPRRAEADSLARPTSRTTSHTAQGERDMRSHLQFFLWDNRLSRLPSALFQLDNLGVLSLRKNRLTHLPPAIGELRHLRELNVGGNALAYLPAEMQRLRLDTFTYMPNPFLDVDALEDARAELRRPYLVASEHAPTPAMPPPSPPGRWARTHSDAHFSALRGAPHDGGARTSLRTVALRPRAAPSDGAIVRVLGPLRKLPCATLQELCIVRLLGDDDGGGMLLAAYETGCLHALQRSINVRLVAQLEAARRSGTRSWGSRTSLAAAAQSHDSPRCPPARGRRWYDDTNLRDADSDTDLLHAFPADCYSSTSVDEHLDMADDALENVWFNRCPGAHAARPGADATSDWPIPPHTPAPLFVRPQEERLEWVSQIAGIRVAKQGAELLAREPPLPASFAARSGCLPILWRGCSRGCLGFLEQERGEEGRDGG